MKDPAGLEVYILAWVFTYIPTLCLRAAKPLVSLHICVGSPEPSLLESAISTRT